MLGSASMRKGATFWKEIVMGFCLLARELISGMRENIKRRIRLVCSVYYTRKVGKCPSQRKLRLLLD